MRTGSRTARLGAAPQGIIPDTIRPRCGAREHIRREQEHSAFQRRAFVPGCTHDHRSLVMGVKFSNAAIIDGTGKAPFLGSVMVEHGQIVAVTEAGQPSPPDEVPDVIDCGGRTLMPGLTEAHCHISFNDIESMLSAVAIQPE